MIKKILFIIFALFLLGILTLVIWLASIFYVFGNSPVITDPQPSLGNYQSLEQWQNDRENLISQFEENIYGAIPTVEIDWEIARETIDDQMYGGLATIEEIILSDPNSDLELGLVLVRPNNIENAPLVIGSSFCANHNSWGQYRDLIRKPANYPAFCDMPDNWMVRLTRPIFGDMISTYPDIKLLERGIAIVGYYPGDVVPDSRVLAPAALQRLSDINGETITGAVAAWAWGYVEVARVMATDPTIDAERIVTYGHSRNGKAAILSSIASDNIAGLIVHQSGTAGASLEQNGIGESIASITDQYAFWFDSTYKQFVSNPESLPVDQHQLLALVAPKPAIYTGARFDKWSDPQGAFAAMKSASLIYKLFNSTGSNAKDLLDFRPSETVSFFMRPATHGVRSSDWDAFLAFLDDHFVDTEVSY